jgi:Rps23 Pro-64 3,4-dihydroxylase Tpa1-like proline 4-hydroxylase
MIHEFSRDVLLVEDNVFDPILITEISNYITEQVKKHNESYLSLDTREFKLLDKILPTLNALLYNYCEAKGVDADRISLRNFQMSNIKAYCKELMNENLYEPHDDIAEKFFVAAVVYIDSDYTDDNWVGGELTLYKNTTYLDYPNNITNVKPLRNRVVFFPGYYVHRIKPYFGKTPRQTLVFGWEIDDQWLQRPIIL